MNSTALGATNKTESGIMFKSNAHEKFYYEKLYEGWQTSGSKKIVRMQTV